jgi:hypothetical protein
VPKRELVRRARTKLFHVLQQHTKDAIEKWENAQVAKMTIGWNM